MRMHAPPPPIYTHLVLCRVQVHKQEAVLCPRLHASLLDAIREEGGVPLSVIVLHASVKRHAILLAI